MRVDANEGKSNSMLALCLSQPAERVVAITEQTVDDCYLIGSDPPLRTIYQKFFQNSTCLIMLSCSSEHVCAFSEGSRGVSRKTLFLLVGSESLIVHSFLFIGPTQHCVCCDSTPIKLQGFTTLRNSFVKFARKKQHVGYTRRDNRRLRRNLARPFDFRVSLVVSAHR